MRQAANAVFDLAVLDGRENLIGTVFRDEGELDHYLPYFTSLVGKLPEQDVAEGEEENLEVLADLLRQSCPCLPSPRPPTQITFLNRRGHSDVSDDMDEEDQLDSSSPDVL